MPVAFCYRKSLLSWLLSSALSLSLSLSFSLPNPPPPHHRDWPLLQAEDQLLKARAAGAQHASPMHPSHNPHPPPLTRPAGHAFAHYNEAALDFPPTYRYHKGDHSPQRDYLPLLCSDVPHPWDARRHPALTRRVRAPAPARCGGSLPLTTRNH